jgi:hypothetical protein
MRITLAGRGKGRDERRILGRPERGTVPHLDFNKASLKTVPVGETELRNSIAGGEEGDNVIE